MALIFSFAAASLDLNPSASRVGAASTKVWYSVVLWRPVEKAGRAAGEKPAATETRVRATARRISITTI